MVGPIKSNIEVKAIKRLQACSFIKKETLAQVFSCEFCEIFWSTFFKEHLRWLLLSFQCSLQPIEANAAEYENRLGTGRKLNVHKTLRGRLEFSGTSYVPAVYVMVSGRVYQSKIVRYYRSLLIFVPS